MIYSSQMPVFHSINPKTTTMETKLKKINAIMNTRSAHFSYVAGFLVVRIDQYDNRLDVRNRRPAMDVSSSSKVL
jgi:hypothetical protein